MRGHGDGGKAERGQDSPRRQAGGTTPPAALRLATGRATKCGGSVRGVPAVIARLNRGYPAPKDQALALIR